MESKKIKWEHYTKELNRLDKLNHIGFLRSNSHENINRFISRSINLDYGPSNMTTKLLDTFSDNIFKHSWYFKNIGESRNGISRIWLYTKRNWRWLPKSNRNKKTPFNSYNLDKDDRFRCDLSVENGVICCQCSHVKYPIFHFC